MIEAVGVEGVHELGEGPGGAHDAEHGQEHAPACQRSSEVKCRSIDGSILGQFEKKNIAIPVGHVSLTSKNEQHVNTTGPSTDRSPVFFHPYPDN